MCTRVFIGENEIEQIWELQSVVGRRAMKFHEYYGGDIPGRCCLCPVDIPATARAAGYHYKESEHDPMAYIWTKD